MQPRIGTAFLEAEDTALFIQADSLQRRALSTANNAQAQAQLQLDRVRRHMQEVEEELGRLIEELEVKARTA